MIYWEIENLDATGILGLNTGQTFCLSNQEDFVLLCFLFLFALSYLLFFYFNPINIKKKNKSNG